ncbi:MAG TPA: DUF2905 domain-containing protein [Bdellovibrionota bacterium]|jgi:hypothetical protein
MDLNFLARTLIATGLLIAVVGCVLLFKDKVPGLDRLGKLPGDIYYEKGNMKVYFPLATSILVSVLLSLLFWLFRRSG